MDLTPNRTIFVNPMREFCHPCLKDLFALVLIIAGLTTAKAQSAGTPDTTFVIRDKAFYLPAPARNGDFRHMISITRYFLPSDWTNVAINAPMFNYTARYSLPAGFAVEGGVSTLFITNRFPIGIRYAHSFKNLHVGLTYQYAYNIGFLYEWGFTTQLTSWSRIPSISVGYSFNSTSLTLKAGWEYIGAVKYTTGENTMTSNEFKWNGSNVSLILEQKLVNKHVMTFAFEMDHVNFAMVAWPAYPVNKKMYYVPVIIWGYTF